MAVFTLLNCGTNFSRDKKGELVADFGANMQGTEYVDFLITEGPGGSAPGHLMPGTFDPFTKDKTAKGKSPKWSQTGYRTLLDVSQGEQVFEPSGHGFLRGIMSGKPHAGITGHGWDDNIRHAVAVLANRFPDLSATLNMIGWSRGAVTCLRMANWIKEFLGDAWKINIFALDPVPGLDAGEKLTDTRIIPDIVDDYVAVLAMDEARGDFRPQDRTRITVANTSKTRVTFLPFPGVHNTVVLQKDTALPEVTAVVRHLAYKFLKDRGTKFAQDPGLLLTNLKLCESYALMHKKRQQYKGLMTWSFMNKQSGGNVPRTVSDSKGKGFFLNEHHRLVFKAAFPDVYSYFFSTTVPNPFGKTTLAYRASDPWGQKFQQFYQSAPESFAVLSGIVTLERGGGFKTPAFWRVSAPGAGGKPLPDTGIALVQSLL